MITLIIGWSCLAISWVIPRFFKDKIIGRFVSGALAAFATGIFVGDFLASI